MQTDWIKIEIRKKVTEICNDWQIPVPKIKWITRGRHTAGYAGAIFDYEGKAHDFILKFNLKFLSGRNYKYFMEQTVPHEMAHIIAYTMYGEIGLGHGEYWQDIMENGLGIPAEVHHSMSVAREYR